MAPQTAPRVNSNPRADAQDTLLASIQEIWAAVLGVEQIGPDDDFFANGGNSLGLATAAALLGERIGIAVPPSILLTASTPVSLAEQIAELRGGSHLGLVEGITPFFPDWVVPLQTEGGGRPVFVFPGGAGNRVLLAKDAQIAAMVGRVHPFYGFHREEPHVAMDRDDWVAATTADYVTQMRIIQGRGPYLLYAICSGASFAWEAAHQLLNAGAEVAGMLFYEAELADEPGERGRPRYVPLGPPPGRAPSHVPEPLAVDLTLLMTEAWHAEGKSDGWFQVARGRVDTVVMPGSTPGVHGLYYRRETMIAGHVRDWIARTEVNLTAP
jgi:acyl carrier protein